MKLAIGHIEILSILHGVILQDTENQIPEDLGPLMEPDPIPFTFSTPGWYFIGIVLFLLVSYATFKRIKKYNHNAYRRKALDQVNQILNSRGNLQDDERLFGLLAQLKIVAVHSYGRFEVASKYGDEWWSFLESTGKNTPFSDYKKVISDSIYKQISPDSSTLLKISDLTKRWIKTHA